MRRETVFALILVVFGSGVVTGSFQPAQSNDSGADEPTPVYDYPVRPDLLELARTPRPDSVKAEYRQMPFELLLRISQLASTRDLETLRPLMGGPDGVGLTLWGVRPGAPYPHIEIYTGSNFDEIDVMGGTCRVRDRELPGGSYGPDPEILVWVTTQACLLIMSPEVGWPKIRWLLGALSKAQLAPLAIDPTWGVALSPVNERDFIHFGLELRSASDYAPYPILKYAGVCKVSDPACLRLWEQFSEEFWLPLKTRYPWLPEPGAPEWGVWGYVSEKTPEGKRYRETSPVIDCLHLDIGRMTARTECTPDRHWTEADERRLKERLGRKENAQNKPFASSSDN
jgi:hypothetical protein